SPMIPDKKIRPALFVSREGYEIDRNELRWKLSRDETVGFEWTTSHLSATLQESYLALMVHYAEKFAPGTTQAANFSFKSLARYICQARHIAGSITAIDLINYRSAIGPDAEPRLGALATLLRTWSNLDLPGVSNDVI